MTVELKIDGQLYSGWLSASVSVGIEQMARGFSLSVTDRWPGSETVRRIKPFQSCEIFLDGQIMISGYVDSTPIQYDSESISVSVEGRSKTGDLIDCAADTKRWSGATVSKITSDLCAPYSISVRCLQDSPIDAFSTKPGETVFEAILRLVSRFGFLVYDDPKGDLVISKPSSEKITHVIEAGVNALSGSCQLDYSSSFSDWHVIGQTASDRIDGVSVSSIVKDPDVKRYRKKVMTMSGPDGVGSCKKKADFELKIAKAKTLETVYRVAGWKDSTGRVWSPNTMAAVKDTIIGIDRDMLITKIDFSLDSSAYETYITVCPVEAFS